MSKKSTKSKTKIKTEGLQAVCGPKAPVMSFDPRLDQPVAELALYIPYRIRSDGTTYLLRDIGGRTFFEVGFSKQTPMTEEKARRYVETYLRHLGIKAEIQEVNIAYFDKVEPALDGKDPLNAIKALGYVNNKTILDKLS